MATPAVLQLTSAEDEALTALPALQAIISAKQYHATAVLAPTLCADFVERLDSPRAADALDARQWHQLRTAVIDRVPITPEIQENRQYLMARKMLGATHTLSKLFCVYLPLAGETWTDYWDASKDGVPDPALAQAVRSLHQQFEALDPNLLTAVAKSINTQISVE
jgi:hypothetical protein